MAAVAGVAAGGLLVIVGERRDLSLAVGGALGLAGVYPVEGAVGGALCLALFGVAGWGGAEWLWSGSAIWYRSR